MRKIVLVSCVVYCFVWQVKAQTEFAPIGAEWYYTYTFGYSPNHFNHIISEKDTIVEGNNCRILRQYYDDSNIANEKYIIKQEQSKVYYYYQDQFNLLYDFDAEVNDTVKFSLMGVKYFFDGNQNPAFYSKDTIFSIRFVVKDITINAQNLKTFTTEALEEDVFDTYFPSSYIYTEKIGLHSEFILKIEDIYYIPEFPPYNSLRCYSDADFSFISDEWTTISLPCDYSLSSNINTLKDEENVKIYPNPFSNNIFVSTNNGGNVTIIDISGKIIHYSELSNGVNKISTNHFSKGTYFVKVQNKNNSSQIFKTVKL